MISPVTLSILRATSETEPRLASEVRELAGISDTRRAIVFHVLGELRARGLVTVDNAAWPPAWSRTERGTEWLAETAEGVEV